MPSQNPAFRFFVGVTVLPLVPVAPYSGNMVDTEPNLPDDASERDAAASPSGDAGEGMSVEQLRGAFAGLLGEDQPSDDESDSSATGETVEFSHDSTTPAEVPDLSTLEAADDDACPVSPRSVLEAMLFVGDPANRPLSPRNAAALMRGVSPREVEQLVAALNQQYAANGCPYEITSEASGYRLVLREQFHSLRSRFYGKVREARLSRAALDVLAIVAYSQGLTSDEISQLRDKASGSLLTQLVRRQLLRIERSDEKPRRPRYFTTDRFLSLFQLGGLQDLPRSAELETA
jgi:segregation and condensation protein B